MAVLTIEARRLLSLSSACSLSLVWSVRDPPSENFQIFRFIENTKTSYVHGRASPRDSISRKQLENGQFVQILRLGPPSIIVVRHFI